MSKRLVTAREIWDAPKPTDLMAWAVCPYIGRNYVDLRDCQRCPEWENDPDYGKTKRGCRMSAEEACRVVQAAKAKTNDAPVAGQEPGAKPGSP